MGYCTIEDVTNALYGDDRTTWLALGTANRARLIDLTSGMIDELEIEYIGDRLDPAQTTAFPRDFGEEIAAGVDYSGAWHRGDGIIPAEVKRAVVQLIKLFLDTFDHEKIGDLICQYGLTGIKAGMVDLNFGRDSATKGMNSTVFKSAVRKALKEFSILTYSLRTSR